MEMKKTKTEMIVSTVGKPDPKRHLQSVWIVFQTKFRRLKI
jgi:hypothetical protein